MNPAYQVQELEFALRKVGHLSCHVMFCSMKVALGVTLLSTVQRLLLVKQFIMRIKAMMLMMFIGGNNSVFIGGNDVVSCFGAGWMQCHCVPDPV